MRVSVLNLNQLLADTSATSVSIRGYAGLCSQQRDYAEAVDTLRVSIRGYAGLCSQPVKKVA